MPIIHLKAGRDRSVRRRHPWIFSGAVASVEGDPHPGETVEVLSDGGEWLARAAISPSSQIRARIWTWDQADEVGPDLLGRRWRAALGARRAWVAEGEVTAFREIYAESDGLPGVIVDRYGPYRVIQLLTAGAEAWRGELCERAAADPGILGVYERSDADVRELEGLAPRSGAVSGDIPPGTVEIAENGLRFQVDLRRGQKTGFYLDQRDHRRLVGELAAGAEVLDCFAYTGAFSIAALRRGAIGVLAVDSSQPALDLAEINLRLNGLPEDRWQAQRGDAFEELRRLRDGRRSFDLIILDPPRFAATSAHANRAARAYKDINLLAFKLLRPGGRLVTFSCSSGVGPDLFQKIVAGAALDAGVEASIQAWLGQPADHPVGIHFPEGRYLKGLVCQVG